MVYMPRPQLPPRPESGAHPLEQGTSRLQHRAHQIRVITFIALAAVIVIAAAVAFLLARTGSPPSAQCKAQVARVALLENDAAAISGSGQVVSPGAISRFDADVLSASVLLRQAKKEGCPVTGYPGGYKLK
jgi:hypothetical protein